MKTKHKPAPDALLADAIRTFPPAERERLAAAILPDFAALLESGGDFTGMYPPAERWGRVTAVRAVVDAVEYLAARARLLDRIEDAFPAIVPRMEYIVERKEVVA